MINKSEIEAKAREFEILESNVQRDYVFGWLLFGLFTFSKLKDQIFLKGGNALRKGYLKQTRFSEDLDFGTPGNISQDLLMEEFRNVCQLIQDQTGVQFLQNEHQIKEKFPVTDGAGQELKVYEVRLYFRNFQGNAERIKIRISIDLTRYDKTILPIQSVDLIHPYSDSGLVGCQIRCCKLEEIIATKLKCLLQRQHAPDLFDYVYSVKLLGGTINRTELVTTFIRKTIFSRNPHVVKDILLKTPFGFFRDYWDKTVVCAKAIYFGVEDAISTFTEDLSELFRIYPSYPIHSFAFFGADLRVPIMEAARTMTCLKVIYDGRERLVEPYSLRYMQRRDGVEREYFYVYDRTGGNSPPGVKTLVAEKLRSIENTEEQFEPRFPIELSKAGEMPEQHLLFDPNRPMKPPTSRRSTQARHDGPKYIYRCSRCNKQFTRSEMNNTLNPHKAKDGRPCFGTWGSYVTTKW